MCVRESPAKNQATGMGLLDIYPTVSLSQTAWAVDHPGSLSRMPPPLSLGSLALHGATMITMGFPHGVGSCNIKMYPQKTISFRPAVRHGRQR